jgi:hypothetical protein
MSPKGRYAIRAGSVNLSYEKHQLPCSKPGKPLSVQRRCLTEAGKSDAGFFGKPSELISDPFGSSSRSSGLLSHALRHWKNLSVLSATHLDCGSLALRFVPSILAVSLSSPYGKQQTYLGKAGNLEKPPCFPLQIFQPKLINPYQV